MWLARFRKTIKELGEGVSSYEQRLNLLGKLPFYH
jgi:hypothetical protein